jgi:glycosyltransferase involved in cell wall biosynthesis
MNVAEITPLILTFNEESNLRNTLDGVNWASQILIVDSGSTDDTLRIAGEFPQVKVVAREFDHFAGQCNYGLSQIQTPWVLSLDADYRCDQDFAKELESLDGTCSGYKASFRYGIFGRALRSTLYPPRVVLYRTDLALYKVDGHAHRVQVAGEIGTLHTPILHDDYKSISSWLQSQIRYAENEADKLGSKDAASLGWKDRIRRYIIVAPVLTLFYCLFAKRLILDGWPGIFYTMQRVFAELTLSLVLLERKLRK